MSPMRTYYGNGRRSQYKYSSIGTFGSNARRRTYTSYVPRTSNRRYNNFNSYRPRRYTGLPRTVSTINPRPEIKFLDINPGSGAIPATGSVAPIFTPTQGAAANQVLGNTCNLKSVYARFTVTCGPGVDDAQVPAAFRAMLIYDRQSNAGNAAVSDVLATVDVSSFMNLNNRDRFVVLSNEYGTVNPNGQAEVYIEVYQPINMQAAFAGTTIPTTGSVILLLISDQTVVANQPLINGSWRVKFVDC